MQSVDLATGEPAPTRYERSDFCAVPVCRRHRRGDGRLGAGDELIRKLGGETVVRTVAVFRISAAEPARRFADRQCAVAVWDGRSVYCVVRFAEALNWDQDSSRVKKRNTKYAVR